MVTSAMGKMDCLTVRAEAPVRPLLETLLRCCWFMASVLDGRSSPRSRTSVIAGSSLEKNIMTAVEEGEEEGLLR